MARIVEGFHTVTCTVTHLSTNTFAFPAAAGPHLLTPEGVSLGTTVVSKQSAQDHYMTAIKVVSC